MCDLSVMFMKCCDTPRVAALPARRRRLAAIVASKLVILQKWYYKQPFNQVVLPVIRAFYVVNTFLRLVVFFVSNKSSKAWNMDVKSLSLVEQMIPLRHLVICQLVALVI